MSKIWMLPGWGLGRAPLRPLAEALDAEFLDLPGYQGTPLITDFTQAIDALAEQLPPGATLLGWSLGALCSLALAASHPERVSKLILIAASPAFAQRSDWPHGMPLDTLATFTQTTLADPANGIPRFIKLFNQGDQQARQVSRALLDTLEPLAPDAVLGTGLQWLAEQDLRPLLPRVTQPTCLLQGALDPLMPLSAAQSLCDALPDARLVAIPGCAHAPFVSAFDTCLAAIHEFSHD